MGSGKQNKRVSKQDWLGAALQELGRGGVEAVRIERLARILSISKSGFYWHFKDRKDLLHHLLDYWFHEYTEVVTSNPLLRSGDPIKRLKRASQIIQEYKLGRYELAIRAWANHDDRVHQVVVKATNTRMDFIRQIFRDIGFEADEVEMRTALFVCYQAWEVVTFGHMSQRKLSRMRNRRLALLAKP